MSEDYWEEKNAAQDEARRLRAALKDIKELLFDCAASDGGDVRTAYQVAYAALQPQT